ncbi:MAG: hypothetical protein IPL51_15670 [Candidatus Competibacteraceae bacterium]|nr:hypothetical protein [Candidatus Competibacteraceae bacterium]
MHQNQIPIKTTKGLQEIELAHTTCRQKRRQLLILVNGQSTVTEMTKKLMSFGKIQTTSGATGNRRFILRPDPTFNNSQRPLSADPPSKIPKAAQPTKRSTLRPVPRTP